MKCRVLHSSYVIDFLDVGFNSDDISHTIELETAEFLEKASIAALQDWEIHFKVIYGKGSVIRIFRKLPSYTTDKQKQITIQIPIPTEDDAKWGVKLNQLVEVAKPRNEDKNVARLSVHYETYSNRTVYILDCLRRAIAFCLNDGFTVNGIKVKVAK